jgi:hypothetical protein
MKLNTLVLLLAASMSASAFVAPRQSATTTSNTGLFDAKDVSALTKDLTTIFSSEDIDKILPHRYPFALVDKVIEYEAGKVRPRERQPAGVECTECVTLAHDLEDSHRSQNVMSTFNEISYVSLFLTCLTRAVSPLPSLPSPSTPI